MEVVDILQEELSERYVRIKEKMDQEVEGSAEYVKLEGFMADCIKDMKDFYKTSNEYWAKEEERRIDEKKLDDHRVIEEKRIEAQLTIESEKQRLTFKKVAFEMSKIVVPAAISAVTFFVGQKRMIHFEETGRFTSQVSREIHLPRIFK